MCRTQAALRDEELQLQTAWTGDQKVPGDAVASSCARSDGRFKPVHGATDSISNMLGLRRRVPRIAWWMEQFLLLLRRQQQQ